MHVLGVTDYLGNIGGAELSTRSILTSLATRSGVDRVTVVGVDLPDVDRLAFPGVEVDPVRLPDWVDSLPDLGADLVIERLLARAIRPHLTEADVVHAHHRRSAFAASRLDTEIPLLCTVRDFWPVCPISIYHVGDEQCTGCEDRLDDCVEYQGWTGLKGTVAKPYLLQKRHHNRGNFDGFDCAVFIAEHLETTTRQTLNVPNETRVIYNPVEVEIAPREPDARASDSQAVFVTASTLAREKGIDLAVEAVGRLADDGIVARLEIFGDGPMEEKLRRLAAEECPNEAVTFHGRVDPEEVYETMRDATATIFPSRWAEPFGRVTVESMTLGTPVVGSDTGGIAEVVDDGANGLLFAPGDVDDLTEQLRRLCVDSELRRSLSAGGLDAAEAYRPERISQEYCQTYREFLEE